MPENYKYNPAKKEQPEPKLKIASDYVNLDSNPNFSSSILELDNDEPIVNPDQVFVDPFQPLFLPSAPKQKTIIPEPTVYSISDLIKKTAASYLDILDDLVIKGDFSTETFLKDQRGISVAIFLIVLAVFFAFFNTIEI